MPQLLTCSHGHLWKAAGPGSDPNVVCPVCGSREVRAVAGAPRDSDPHYGTLVVESPAEVPTTNVDEATIGADAALPPAAEGDWNDQTMISPPAPAARGPSE